VTGGVAELGNKWSEVFVMLLAIVVGFDMRRNKQACPLP
jgi:hypothetical protein